MRHALVIPFILIFAACAPQKSARSDKAQAAPGDKSVDRPAHKGDVTYVGADWSPDNVEVVCDADRCPLQVGAVIFAGPAVDGHLSLRRCTGFLVSGDTVMSNAHCDGFGKERGWFVSQKINGKKEIREITGVPFKRFTPHPSGEKFSSGRPDVALFTLRSAIPLAGLRLATGPQISFNKLVIFAIMQMRGEQMLVEKTECQVRRHEAEFPFEILEAPDMITSFDCKLKPGTSGSPMFAPGNDEVQALQVGGSSPDNRVGPNQNFANHWTSLAVNLRCLDLPGAKPPTCLKVSQDLIAGRFRDVQLQVQEKLRARRVTLDGSPVQSRATPFLLTPQTEFRFEVMHTPECRKSDIAVNSVPIMIEQVQIQFDEWAMPRIQSLSQVTVNAVARAVQGTIHEILMTWPAASGTYAQPDLDLRKKWGGRFHIDLPLCPR